MKIQKNHQNIFNGDKEGMTETKFENKFWSYIETT